MKRLLWLLLLAVIPASALEVKFSPKGGIRDRILVEIGRLKAGDTLRAAIFNISDDFIGDSVLALRRRGGVALIYTDRVQAGQPTSEIARFRADSISVRVKPGGGLMHNKFALFGNRVLITGSFNWSGSAEAVNEENVVIFTSRSTSGRAAIEAFKARFDSLWAKGQK